MRYSLGQDILNNMFLFFLIIITELQELPPVCVASLMDVLYKFSNSSSQFAFNLYFCTGSRHHALANLDW